MTTSRQAREDVRTGKIDGAVIIPAQYSRRVLAGDSPAIGLVVDNSDQTMSGSLEAEMQSVVDALNAPVIEQKVAAADRAGNCRALPLRGVHEVSSCRFHGAGHVCGGDDRRRHAVYR